MGYKNDTYLYAVKKINERRTAAEQNAKQFKQEVLFNNPRLKEIEESLQNTGLSIAKAVLDKKDTKNKIKEVREKTQALLKERDGILKSLGLSLSCFEPEYFCKICNDTGENKTKLCQCFLDLVRQKTYEELNAETPLKLSSFADFSLDYYSDGADENGDVPREEMKKILSFCKGYAEGLSLHSQNVLFIGATGLGKTHLSLAIAGRAIEKGYGVIYGSTQNLMRKIEKEHFKTGETDEDTETSLIECDLLILDDLGTEFPSAFVMSALYNIINSRILRGSPTIISTNLSIYELKERYHERILSRLIGNFEPLIFTGRDVRQQKFNMERQPGN